MKIVVVSALAAIGLGGSALDRPKLVADAKPVQLAVVCMYKREETSGMNKICYYDCLGSLTAVTIGAAQLCPLTINR